MEASAEEESKSGESCLGLANWHLTFPLNQGNPGTVVTAYDNPLKGHG